ncbi:hypothetical protein PIB30_033391 [Stylosanthes scabra]|uniref:Uncharacterized protein n=1 Tax=Stylosanthes scabra TaxID=79078 RepID=A0ABU6QCU9_9FABA|nr:hypothetical protein [Stylosanthes scabra]
MVRHGNTFDEVHPSKFDLEFHLYVVRLWDAPARCNPNETQTIEMVVEDSKGHRIHLQNKEQAEDNSMPLVPGFLAQNHVLPNHTFDFIREIVGKEDPRDVVMNTGGETKWLVIVLQNTEIQRINSILSGNMVIDIAPHLESNLIELVIVVLQYFKSNFDLSKIHINADFKEVSEFKKRFLEAGSAMFGRISQVTSDNGWAGAD